MAKLAPAKIDKAMQIAAVIAASTAVNGTIPSEKALRQCCISGLKLVMSMDQVVAAVEEDGSLLEHSLDQWVCYEKIGECIAAQKARAVKEVDATDDTSSTTADGSTEGSDADKKAKK